MFIFIHSFDVEALRAKGGKTSTKYVAANPNVGISGGSSAQIGHTCTWYSCYQLPEQFRDVLTSCHIENVEFWDSPFSVRFQSVSTWCQLRHLMLRAVPVLSSSEARARCASWVFRNTTLGNCFKFTRFLKLHAEFQQFNVVVSCCVLFKKHQEIMLRMIHKLT